MWLVKCKFAISRLIPLACAPHVVVVVTNAHGGIGQDNAHSMIEPSMGYLNRNMRYWMGVSGAMLWDWEVVAE
jgi:hypothetical protein